MLFGSITQEPLGLPNFYAIFEFLRKLTLGCLYFPYQKGLDNFEIEHNNANLR